MISSCKARRRMRRVVVRSIDIPTASATAHWAGIFLRGEPPYQGWFHCSKQTLWILHTVCCLDIKFMTNTKAINYTARDRKGYPTISMKLPFYHENWVQIQRQYSICQLTVLAFVTHSQINFGFIAVGLRFKIFSRYLPSLYDNHACTILPVQENWVGSR